MANLNANDLNQYVKKIAKKTFQKEGDYAIVTGTIEESLTGYYNVRLSNTDSNNLIAATAINAITFKKDDYVYLIKATVSSGNDFSSQYFIFGLVKSVTEQFANLSEWERFRALDDGIIDIKNRYLFSASEQEIEISPAEKEIFLANLNKKRHFAAYATFNTPKDWTIESGDFGIKFYFLTEEKSEYKEIKSLSTQFFSGQPYKLRNSLQKILISLNEEDIIKDFKVTYFSTIPETDAFYVENLSLQVGDLIDISDKLKVEVETKTGSKDYFLYKQDGADSVTLEATAYYEDQPLVSDKVKYYWFIESKVVEGLEQFEEYEALGGTGWLCLNRSEEVESSNGYIKIWDAKKNSITFNKESGNFELFSKFTNKIKCVIQYQLAKQTSKEKTVRNFNVSSLKGELVKDGRDALYRASDEIILTCKIIEENLSLSSSEKEYVYTWTFDGVEEPQLSAKNQVKVKSGSKSGYDKTDNTYYLNAENSDVTITVNAYLSIEDGEEDDIPVIFDTNLNSIEIASLISSTDIITEERWHLSEDLRLDTDERNYDEWESQRPEFDQNAAGSDQYLFYTKRNKYYQNGTELAADSWDLPILIAAWKRTENSWEEVSEEQIAADNRLLEASNYGLVDGFYYLDEDKAQMAVQTSRIEVPNKFTADKNLDLVEIGGFVVGENVIEHKNKENPDDLDDYIAFGPNKLHLGQSLAYDYNNENKESTLMIDGTIQSKNYKNTGKIVIWKEFKGED